MAISFTCSACGKAFSVRDELSGRRARCKGCGGEIRVPVRSTAPPDIPEDLDDDRSTEPAADPDRDGVGLATIGQLAVEGDEIEDPAPRPPFAYKMVQVPPVIQVREGVATSGRAAAYLEGVVNEYAGQGWEFFRVDEIGIQTNPGCLGALLGVGPQRTNHYVVTFRQPYDARRHGSLRRSRPAEARPAPPSSGAPRATIKGPIRGGKFPVNCPSCMRRFDVPRDRMGGPMECPGCKRTVMIPGEESAPAR